MNSVSAYVKMVEFEFGLDRLPAGWIITPELSPAWRSAEKRTLYFLGARHGLGYAGKGVLDVHVPPVTEATATLSCSCHCSGQSSTTC